MSLESLAILLALLFAAYLLGSVNFSILLFRLLRLEDPRTCYSGNPGVSNVYRMKGPIWAGLVLLLDIGRAGLIAWLALHYAALPWVPFICLSLVVGNRYPIFHGFRGGKGVSNFLGFVAVLSPIGAAISAVAWVLVFALLRRSFLGSVAMIAINGVAMVVACQVQPLAWIGSIHVVLFILWAHRQNFRQWLAERKNNKN